MPDEEQLQALREDVAALRPKVLARVTKKLLNRQYRGDVAEAAEDITQIIMAVAVAKIHQYSQLGSLEAWLSSIARNEMVSFLIGSKTKVRLLVGDLISQREDFEGLDEEYLFVDLTEIGPLERCLKLEEVRLAVASYRKLLVKYPDNFEAFSHVAILGYTYKETAEMLGLPLGTVKSRVSRAWVMVNHHGNPRPRRPNHSN